VADPPKGLVELVQETTGDVIHGLGQGLERAGAALATPENADVTALLASVDLPELSSEGPLGAIATRLDREADLFRGVALRELARVGWVSRITQTMVVVMATCAVAVAACAVVVAVFGGMVDGRLGLLVLAAAVVGAAGVGVAASASRMRTAHTQLAHDALARARVIEDRLFRVGLAMEWRSAGPTLYQDALARLERDVSPVAGSPSHDGEG
jgi:preprotein translocase subunit SecE